MATQFNGSTTAGTFSPNKTLRTGENSKENEARFASTLNDYYRVSEQNDRTIQENIRQGEEGWKQLSKFSSTLTKTLVEKKQQQNLSEYEAGIADAYMNGLPQEEADEFDSQEAAVEQAGEATDEVAADYEEASNDGAGGQQISESTGWRALGRARGIAQQGGAQYGIYMGQFAAELAGITDPQTYAQRLQEIRKEYLTQFGGMSRGMMAKYMFPKMQEWENRTFLAWQESNNELIQQNALDEDMTQFYAGVQAGDGGSAFDAFIRKHQRRAGGKGKARDMLFKELEKGVQSGDITEADIAALGETIVTGPNGRGLLKDVFRRQYLEMREGIRRRNLSDHQLTEDERQVRAQTILQRLREKQKELGRPFTNDEVDAIEEGWDPTLGPIPQEIIRMRTVEDIDLEDRKEVIESKIKAGLPLEPEDLEGLPSNYRNQYERFLGGRGRSEALSGSKPWVSSLAGEITAETTGGTDKTTDYRNLETNIDRQLAIEFNTQLKITDNPQQALDNAKKIVGDRIRAQAAAYRANPDNASAPWDLDSDVDQSVKSARAIADSQKLLRENPEAFRTTILNQDAVDQLVTQMEGENGGVTTSVPMFFTAIASGMKNIDAFDLANQQLQLAGKPLLVKPEVEQQVDSIPDAEVRELLRFRPTPSRTVRAGKVIEYLTGDRSHEGYRPDHGGSNYHEHIAFDTPETTQAAIELLESNGIFVGSRNDGKHADTSYHYVDQAFDVPLYPNLERFGLPDNRDGEEQFSAMVRDLLGKNGFGGAGIRASNNQPVTSSQKQFLDMVAGPESSNDYDAFNLGGSNGGHTPHGSGYGDDSTNQFGQQISQMTIGELMQLGSSGQIHAAGRYQIIPMTLSGLVRKYGIDTNAVFDEEMQDQLALYLAYARLHSGQGLKGLRNEWLGLHRVSNQQIISSLGGGFNNPALLLPGV